MIIYSAIKIYSRYLVSDSSPEIGIFCHNLLTISLKSWQCDILVPWACCLQPPPQLRQHTSNPIQNFSLEGVGDLTCLTQGAHKILIPTSKIPQKISTPLEKLLPPNSYSPLLQNIRFLGALAEMLFFAIETFFWEVCEVLYLWAFCWERWWKGGSGGTPPENFRFLSARRCYFLHQEACFGKFVKYYIRGHFVERRVGEKGNLGVLLQKMLDF
jgi:hypothetical protein